MAAVLPPTAPYFIDLAKEWAEKAQSDYFHLLWIEKVDLIKGRDSTDAIATRYQVGEFFEQADKFEKAWLVWKEAIELCTQSFGPQHPQTIETKRAIGFALKAIGQFELAYPLYVDLLEFQVRVFGLEHQSTVVRMVGLCELYDRWGKEGIAEKAYLDNMNLLIRELGIQSSVTMQMVMFVAKFYIAHERWERAKIHCLRRCVFDMLVAEQHPEAREPTALSDLVLVLTELGMLWGVSEDERAKELGRLIEQVGKPDFYALMKR
ncbi:UNVERIFIED_CONTAM: hypothetical protein HDU68_005621 [Siphonaria sp. JEL0065]|nr:hypothetical protein HDU68_005621 [Siphonaria sp. JEL0065]